MKIQSVSTGFLTGNLTSETNIDLNATAAAYAAALEVSLGAHFPGADITVDYQDAEGVVPRSLKTCVITEEGDPAEEQECAEFVDRIAADVFEAGGFWVEKTPTPTGAVSPSGDIAELVWIE